MAATFVRQCSALHDRAPAPDAVRAAGSSGLTRPRRSFVTRSGGRGAPVVERQPPEQTSKERVVAAVSRRLSAPTSPARKSHRVPMDARRRRQRDVSLAEPAADSDASRRTADSRRRVSNDFVVEISEDTAGPTPRTPAAAPSRASASRRMKACSRDGLPYEFSIPSARQPLAQRQSLGITARGRLSRSVPRAGNRFALDEGKARTVNTARQ